jgi:hypothetical protein
MNKDYEFHFALLGIFVLFIIPLGTIVAIWFSSWKLFITILILFGMACLYAAAVEKA